MPTCLPTYIPACFSPSRLVPQVAPRGLLQAGAKVVSASYGGQAFSTFEMEAINELGLNGSVLVAAAANDAADIDATPCAHWPAAV